MGIIADVIIGTETVMNGYARTVFETAGPALENALRAAGALALSFVAINHMFNIREVKYTDYIVWFIRFVCIYSFALTWSNFELFYNLFIDIPNSYASSLISAASLGSRLELCVPAGGLFGLGITGLPTVLDIGSAVGLDGDCSPIQPPPAIRGGDNSVFVALDQFSQAIFAIAGAVMKEFVLLDSGTYKYIIASILIYVIGLLFTAYALVIMLVAKLGFTVAMGLAPLAVSMLTFNQTRSYFESWLRLTVGFALVPLLSSAVMSVVILVAFNLQREDDFFGGYMPFALVAVAAFVLMSQIPGLAGQLASTSLPSMGPAAAAAAVGGAASVMSSPMRMGNALNNRASAALNASSITKAQGGGQVKQKLAMMKAFSQSSNFRAEKAGRMAYQRNDLNRALNKDKET